ncbi:low-density lipoprotein receptor-like [Condylostylus longicornis]|uniref:low-density lipoprotein receptor-like n=1 Tax=Condylostylus longicornis TaxID=2530218 RepID=UPI00244E1CF2|nr:low-density lipoprotein receptor-like [Condylostylus longicornis]
MLESRRPFFTIFVSYLAIVVSSQEECENGMKACDNGQCINTDFWCDGEKNCDDGSDESIISCSSLQLNSTCAVTSIEFDFSRIYNIIQILTYY